MKAAFANGVLTAFEEAGHRAFDALYGTSAGGALAAWFTAGQAKYAEDTWAYAADRRVLDYARIMPGGRPMLDHEFLLDHIYRVEHPLNVAAVRKAPHPVIVTASNVDTGAPVYQDLRHVDAIAWLKATGRLPVGSGGPVHLDGARYLDGGLTDPIPVRKAVADGHTRVTLILNTPAGHVKRDHPIMAQYTARRYPHLREGILQHSERKESAMAYAAHPPADVRVDIIRPEASLGLHRLTRDLAQLRRGIAYGHEAGREHIARLHHAAAPA